MIKPILTEKANAQQEKLRRYAFRVNRKANKLEIKKAVEAFYGINVVDVNTVVVPAKTRRVQQKPVWSKAVNRRYKKAMVTVAEGETIDLYSNI